jgi:PIN domain nuclease of toxin-antitoxin system
VGVVLDACALIAFIRSEDGAEMVEQRLIEGGCVAHVLNLCEVYYDCIRRDGETRANAILTDLHDAGVSARSDIDEDFWKDVGRIKADVARISIADCFAVALARRAGLPVLTSDHHEFDRILERGLCGVQFLR